MARRIRKAAPLSQEETPKEAAFNPEDFEDIELPTHPRAQEEQVPESLDEFPDYDSLSQTEQLLSAKEQLVDALLLDVMQQALSAQSGTRVYGFENIVGVGISQKITNNRFTGEECVSVYVVSKESTDHIAPEALVPKTINGIPTDVVATGELHALPHRGRYRPAQPGVSIGHYQITAGTFGCLVRRGSALFVLSNNHVLANSNQGIIGDPIVQPGPFDGGTLPSDVIGSLSQFVPIQFNGPVNEVDAAIGQVSPSLVNPVPRCFGRISGLLVAPQRFQIVKKCGRTTQYTLGIVTDYDATVRIGYGTHGTAIFQNQIVITAIPFILPFSSPGDSGSLIVTEFTNRPVGLLFAGSVTHTIANKIDVVLSRLNVSIVT